MWAHVGEVGYQRELELKEDYWKDVIDAGGTTARFECTFESAWSILENIPGMRTQISIVFLAEHLS